MQMDDRRDPPAAAARDTILRPSQDDRNRDEKRLTIALGILGSGGFVIAAIIWWQLLS